MNTPKAAFRHRRVATLPVLRLVAGLLLSSILLCAQSRVYVVLWFDTEDYVEPAADDAALRIATDLTELGVRATFKIVGEKARVLEERKRIDVIRALSKHCIGYHSNFHSIQPVPAVYLRRLGFEEGAAEFERRESPGVADVRRIFGVQPVCYGQPGSSWAPQTSRALRHMNIPVYLDEGTQVGLDGQPFWYGGLLHIFNMGRFQIRPDLDHEQNNREIFAQFDKAAGELSKRGGGVISTYFHPTEFVTTEFWDAVNFSKGATRERRDWVKPHRRSPEETARCYGVLRAYVQHAKQVPGVEFVTAQDLLQRYESPIPARVVEGATVAAALQRGISFVKAGSSYLSPADMVLQLLGLPAAVIDGPSHRGVTTYTGTTIDRAAFQKVKHDAAAYIQSHYSLPSEVFVGAESLSLADFAATMAGEPTSGGAIQVLRAKLDFERYFATDPTEPFRWPIHPEGFSAPELLEMARLQGWTLKPAQLR